jgi:hypothetical protein
MNMHLRRDGHFRLIAALASILLIAGILTGCLGAAGTQVSPARGEPAATAGPPEETTPLPAGQKVLFPATWTPTATSALDFPPTRTPMPTANFAETRAALTVIAEGIKCKRAPNSWKIFVSPAQAVAGWCDVVGTEGTIYEYKLTAPDGWTISTFGGMYPNLAFATGKKNVQVRLYQSYAYLARSNYDGTLEEAPEKAFFCDENENCRRYLSPHETLVRQTMETSGARDILVLDSTAGDLMIRRYYQILPFKTRFKEGPRLFILELRWLNTALTEAEHAEILENLNLINRSLWQR